MSGGKGSGGGDGRGVCVRADGSETAVVGAKALKARQGHEGGSRAAGAGTKRQAGR
jgi:hypothetical protein